MVFQAQIPPQRISQIVIKKNMKKIKKQLGFTIFELLVSISIIGIMTALAAVAYSGAQKKARDSRRVQDIRLIQVAAEQYYSQNNYDYPADSTTPWMGGTQEILSVFPVDPKNDAVNGYVYTYKVPVVGQYCVCAKVENTSNCNASDDNCTFVASGGGDYYCAKNQQ